MANRVELRLPLVDHRLVETVVGLRKTSGDDRKPAKEWLRRAMAPLLPEQVLARKKRPFLPPLETWHRRLMDAYGPSLEHGLLVELGILRPAAAGHLAAGRFPPHAGSTLSFKALVLELWLRLVCGLEADDPRAAGLETSPAPAG
jgi:asparagine synthase (glutamine-hydrolysing)